MVNSIKIAVAQLDIEPGRPDINFERIKRMVDEAGTKGAQVVVFPELAISGYLIGDLWEEEAFVQDCLYYGDMIRRLSRDICIVFGNVGVDETAIGTDGRRMKYNGVYVAYERKFVRATALDMKFQPKTLLPNYREFEETRHFSDLLVLSRERGQSLDAMVEPFEISIGGTPFRIGCTLCEDGWGDDYSVDIMGLLAQKQCDLLLNLSSSPFTLGKKEKRDRVFSRHAQSAGVPVLYVNNVGIQNNAKTIFSFDGQSTLYDHEGAIVFKLPAYKESLFVCSLGMTASYLVSPNQKGDNADIEEVAASLIYTTDRYLKQCELKRVVIGVSGGIDSAVAAALYAQILPPENMLLVNMPSRYNSTTTKNLAKELADAIGCFYTDLSIEESVALTLSQIDTLVVTGANGKSETLQLSGFHLENIQARDRSSRILAALSASFGGVFTCNANKAETTVGYSTLYGDHGGFLAALADLWKEQVYALGRYLNSLGDTPLIPEGTFTIVPSAELSDAQDVDADKGDPLVYWYHDRLFHAWMQRWNRVGPQEILQWYHQGVLEKELNLPHSISTIFTSDKEFIDDLERWWGLFKGMGVAKRVQAPPIIAVSRRVFGYDYRESLMKPYYSVTYNKLRSKYKM